MTFLSTIVLALFALLMVVILIQNGGFVDSLRRLERIGPKLIATILTAGVLGALYYRGSMYMNPERESWVVTGPAPSDSVSAGFDTKSRFRSMAQPLGRVFDRSGKQLAGYTMVDGHLRRTYPAGDATAHLVGYWTGPLRDGVGIEKGLTLLNDSLKDDRPHDVTLTVDLRLQRDAIAALGRKIGAIVVMDPSNGEVLAAANYPSYDPNRIWNDTAWRRYVLDLKLRPLTSRAVKDNFSPGSSVKPWVALSAHDLGIELPEEKGFVCAGSYVPSSRIKPIGDHGSVHGRIDMARAMRVSCNVYFSYLAYKLVTFDAMAGYLDSLGFNERLRWNTGIFLNEYSTLLPALSWTRARDEIARTRVGIGQASIKTNPLHMATLLAGVANGGVFMRPTLERGREADTLPWRISPAAAEWLEPLLREPLLPGGTGAGAFAGFDAKGFTVYGKTGTADMEPDGREPSWWISYAEKNGKRYVVVVAIQNREGRYAGEVNAPMARRLYEALDAYGYFRPAPVVPAADSAGDRSKGVPEGMRRK